MKNRRFRFAILFAAIAPSHAVAGKPASAQLSAGLPDNLAPTFPREGVDHVVTYESWRGWGPKGGDRIVLFRHGAMIRTDIDYIGSRRAGEDAHTTTFSNLATAAALSVTRDTDGALSSVSMSRGGRSDIPLYRHTIVSTSAWEMIAGERCAVWLAKPEDKEGVAQTACITRDGAVLRESVLYRDGSVMEERRAIKVERRQVRPEEVLPPAEALHWPTWVAHSATVATTDDKEGNYELTLAGNKQGKSLSKTIRQSGAWYWEEDQADSATQALLIFRAGVTLAYGNHDHPLIRINRSMASLVMDPRMLQSAPLAKPDETVVGERCTWFNAAINVSDYGRLECRTADHLPLIRNEYSWGGLRVSWLATGLSRGHTSPDSVVPPSSLMDWAFWGWPELAKH